jgi:hypothetical protein
MRSRHITFGRPALRCLFSVLSDVRKRVPRGTDTESDYMPLIVSPYRIVQTVRAFFKNISRLNELRLKKIVRSKTKNGMEKLRTKDFSKFRPFHITVMAFSHVE